MGCNYYLKRKCEFNPLHKVPSTLGCGNEVYFEPRELINGWVFNSKYYATVESLNDDFYQVIHIGKSSDGWRFGLCTYPTENPKFKDDATGYHEYYLDKPISSLDDWIELFNDPNNLIEDEYGNTISKEKMIDIITNRKPNGELLEGWHRLYAGTPSESDEEYFFIKGLMAHKIPKPNPFWIDVCKHEKFVKIMPEDCTYDLIESGNDSDVCRIFC